MANSMEITRCTVSASLAVNSKKDMGDIDSIADPTQVLSLISTDSLQNGFGADQASLIYSTSGSIAASGSQAFDLVGSLTSVYGDTINFDNVRGVYVINTSTTNQSQINVVDTSGIFSVAAGDGVKLIPSSTGNAFFFIYTPSDTAWDVSAGTDTITLTNQDSTNAATYQIAVLGAEIDSSSSSSESSSSESSSSSSDSSSSSSSESSSSP